MRIIFALLAISLVITTAVAGQDHAITGGPTSKPKPGDLELTQPGVPCGLGQDLCETKPPGRLVALGNTKANKICITPFRRGVPRQVGDFLCDILLGNFIRAKLDQDAEDNCVRTLGVQCNRKQCKVNCVNDFQVNSDQGVYYIRNDFDCRNDPQAPPQPPPIVEP